MKTPRRVANLLEPASCLLGALAASLLLAEPCRAERELVPLGNLFAESAHVVLGDVVSVAAAGSPAEVATVEIGSVIANPVGLSTDIEVAGSPTDPEGHAFAVGQRLLLFLQAPAPGQPEVLRLTHPGAAFGLPPGATAALEGLLVAARDHAGRPPLAFLVPFLSTGGPAVPLGVLAAALEQLAIVSDPADTANADAVVGLACGTTPAAHPIVRLWALGHVGRLRLESGRACLAELVQVPRRRRNDPYPKGDRALQMRAVTGLVDLGGPPSVLTLDETLLSLARIFNDCDPPELATATAHALGILSDRGEPVGSRTLAKVAIKSPSTVLTSTAVYALGLVGDSRAQSTLRRLAHSHAHPLIRSQAAETLARLGQ